MANRNEIQLLRSQVHNGYERCVVELVLIVDFIFFTSQLLPSLLLCVQYILLLFPVACNRFIQRKWFIAVDADHFQDGLSNSAELFVDFSSSTDAFVSYCVDDCFAAHFKNCSSSLG